MMKYNQGLKLPNLDDFIELNPLTVVREMLVIDAITLMNQPRQIDHNRDLTPKYHPGVACSSYVLVLEQSQLVGVLTERDIVKLSANGADLKVMTVAEVMTRNVITLNKSDFQDIYQIMSILNHHQIRHLPIVNDLGQLEGIISTHGIAVALNPSNLLKLRSVTDVMKTNILLADPTASVQSLSQLMAQHGHSCVIIVATELNKLIDVHFEINKATPLGIITERDLLQFQILGLDLANTPAHTVMSTPLISMKTTDSLLDVQQQMRQLRVRRLVISGESGKLQGIISLQDMMRVFDTTELYGVISTLKQELNQQTRHLQREIEQREKSKKILQENQQLLELFVHHTPAAIAMLDREMRYLVVSDRWIEDYQLKDQEIIGLTHYEVFPEIPQRWKQDHQNCLSGKVKVLKSEEDSFVRLDGKVDWLRWELRPWYNQEEEIAGLLMFSEVITEKKRLEQQLHSSEAQMRAMFKAMSDLVFTIDIINNSIQILPTKFSDISNPNVWQQIQEDIFNGVDAQRYRSLNQKILQTQQTFEFEYRLKLFDSWIWFSVNVSAVSPTIVMWVARNISHRKQMEQNLFAEKELAQITLKSIGDAVITTDALGKVTYLNPIAEELTGWATAEVRGKPLADFFEIVNHSSRKPVANPINLALKENKICELSSDTLLIARDASEYAIEDSAAPIHDHQGKLMGAVMVFHDVTQSRRLAQELSWQATHDPLTRLHNRRKFEEQVDVAIKNAQDNGTHHALCYLDLDRFKIINDTCGHAAGDELLKQITKLLKQRIRNSDVFARLGGDEFGLIFHQCPLDIAQKIANQLRQLVHDFRFVWSDQIFNIGISIGLVAINSNTNNLTSLLRKADTACYAAKEKGRNCVHVYQEEAVIVQQRGANQWIEKINRALEKNQFCLYAQKIVSLAENCLNGQSQTKLNSQCGECIHHEILLRLIDDSGKIIAPGTFIPAAERYDLMPAIDRWVITTFLAGYEIYCQSRQEQKLQPPTNIYTINLSGASINNQEFGTFLKKQFARYAIPAKTICFEITETVAISNLDRAVTLIKQLKKLGCSIALDDFGSGMSSLTYLKNLPVDYLKIDGSFVKNIDHDQIDYATVECFNHISQIMKIKTIAEFVENDAILQNIQKIGINYAQGYGIGRPQPLAFGSASVN